MIAVSVSLVLTLDKTARLLDHLDAAVIEIQNTTVQAGQELRATNQNVNAILLQTGLAADQARLAAAEQRQYWNATAKQTDLTVRAVRQLIDRTDRQLNDSLLPGVESNSTQVSAAAEVSLEALAHSADVLTKQLNDPHVASLAAHLDGSAQNVEETTAHLSAASADIEVKVHQMTRPASFALRVGKTLIGIGAQVGAMMGGLGK